MELCGVVLLVPVTEFFFLNSFLKAVASASFCNNFFLEASRCHKRVVIFLGYLLGFSSV
jgi:hypothetical protein